MRFRSDHGGARRYYPLREGSFFVGRHPSCEIVVPGRNVSKKHIQCFVEDGAVTIRDLGSANGTFVNGSPVTSCIIKHGDDISLGGYHLVLDTSIQEAEAAEPPAQGAFDYEPHRPAAPGHAEQAVSAPEAEPVPSFDEPTGDDTPADGAFVPQAYAPQSLQPQVVARDGHMYLRDPRTNREVEIVPRGAGPQTDLSGYYAEKEAVEGKKNRYLIGGAIAVGLLMIIALVLTSGPEASRPVEEKPFSRTAYNEMAEKGVALMKAGEFTEAAALLAQADQVYPTYRVAGVLKGIAEQWSTSGKSFDEFNWKSVESSLNELMESRWTTAKVRDFTSNRIDWIYNVENQRAVAEKAKSHLAAGEPEQALDEFRKLPQDSLVRAEHTDEIAATVVACYQKHLDAAKTALDSQDWEGAISEFKEAEKFATEHQKRETNRGFQVARVRIREEEALAAGALRFRRDTVPDLEAARNLVKDVDGNGPLGRRKADLIRSIDARLAQLERERESAAVLANYRAGRGADAIRLITENKLTELDLLRSRIEKVMRTLDEASEAYDAGDFDLAKAKWTQAAREETDRNNTYYQRAAAHLKELDQPRKRVEIAREYMKRGGAALNNDKPEDARKLFRRAIEWDPDGELGKVGLAEMDLRARRYYNDARNFRYQGSIGEAVTLFEKVLRYTDEGDEYHKRATRQLGELKNLQDGAGEAQQPEE